MAYESPRFEEIKMDAEIGSYQEDFEFDPNFDPVIPHAQTTAAEPRDSDS